MNHMYDPKLIPFAKRLRKDMTKEERHLWYDFLRDYPVRFYRQKVVGRYIVDFYCSRAGLVVELDGSQHFESDGQHHDEERTAFLKTFGLEVFRIANNDVMHNFTGVCEAIDLLVKQRTKGSPCVQGELAQRSCD